MTESEVVWHGSVNTPWRGYLNTEAVPTRSAPPLPVDLGGARDEVRDRFAIRVDHIRALLQHGPHSIEDLMVAADVLRWNIRSALRTLRREGVQSEVRTQAVGKPIKYFWMEPNV